MPYKTRADKDRELWITPKEAVAHVCEVEHCPAKEARKQIINALKDEEIEARWPDFDPNFPKDPGDIYRQELDKFSDWAQGKYIGYTIVNWNPGAALYYNPDRNRRTSWFDLRAAKVRPEVVCRGLPLLFLKQNVMRLWPTIVIAPLKAKPKVIDQPPYATGLPGRPTSWHLVEPEVMHRWKKPQNRELTLSDWAEIMLKWTKVKHPAAARLTIKTLENRLRILIRTLRKTASTQ